MSVSSPISRSQLTRMLERCSVARCFLCVVVALKKQKTNSSSDGELARRDGRSAAVNACSLCYTDRKSPPCYRGGLFQHRPAAVPPSGSQDTFEGCECKPVRRYCEECEALWRYTRRVSSYTSRSSATVSRASRRIQDRTPHSVLVAVLSVMHRDRSMCHMAIQVCSVHCSALVIQSVSLTLPLARTKKESYVVTETS